jgi:peptide/nickel transport system substrate-binding protein
VRRAVAHAIDRQAVVDLVMFGYGTPIGSHWSPARPPTTRISPGDYPYDPEKARTLLKEAGYPEGFAATIKLPAIYSYSRRAGEVIADMLAKVGIDLTIEIVEWGQWIDRIFKKKEYQLTMIGHVEAWDIGIYAKPDYYFQYDSKANSEMPMPMPSRPRTKPARQNGSAAARRSSPMMRSTDFSFPLPSLPVMKAKVMGWWENYPTSGPGLHRRVVEEIIVGAGIDDQLSD